MALAFGMNRVMKIVGIDALVFAFFHFLTSFHDFYPELNSILKTVSQNAEKGADFCVFQAQKVPRRLV